MLDPDEALHYLDFLESRAVAGEDEPPRDAASTALAAAPHALPSRTAPALEVSASKMDDGLPPRRRPSSRTSACAMPWPSSAG